jgi:hypothetical protein
VEGKSLRQWLKQAWAGWKKVASFIGRIQTRILLTVFYAVIAGPVSPFFRGRSGGRKDTARSDKGYWEDYVDGADELERARRQF